MLFLFFAIVVLFYLFGPVIVVSAPFIVAEDGKHLQKGFFFYTSLLLNCKDVFPTHFLIIFSFYIGKSLLSNWNYVFCSPLEIPSAIFKYVLL